VRFWTVGFDRLLEETLPQIRHYGASDATVMSHLLMILKEIGRDASTDVRRTLENHGRWVVDDAMTSLELAVDRDRVRAAGEWALGSRPPQ
jgi:uncharacterized membrane protein